MNINPIQIMQMLPRIKSDPMSMLSGFGISQDISNNPQAIIQNMMNNGKVSQDVYNQAMQIAKNMGVKF